MGIVLKGRTKFPNHTPWMQVGNQMLKGYTEIADGVLRDFQKTTKTWNHQPIFSVRRLRNGIQVGTSDDLYVLVNKGAPPHTITAKNAPFLVFQAGFRSKSEPYWIGSRKGAVFGDTVVKQSVDHPGFQGRDFDIVIAERWRHKVGQILQVSVKNGLRGWLTGYTTVNIG